MQVGRHHRKPWRNDVKGGMCELLEKASRTIAREYADLLSGAESSSPETGCGKED